MLSHSQGRLMFFIFLFFTFFIIDVMSMGKNMVKELLGAFPGIDEAMSFAEVMRYVASSQCR